MRLFVLLALLALFSGRGGGICVVDNKKGWNVQCGLRDSYLFRIKDVGGLKANFDFGFGLGDEEGFSESIRNTQGGGYYKRNDDEAEIQEEEEVEERPHFTRYGRPQVTRRNDGAQARPPPRRPPPRRRPIRRPVSAEQRPDLAARQANGNVPLPVEHRSPLPQQQSSLPSFGLRPPPPRRRESPGGFGHNTQGQVSGTATANGQRIVVRPGSRPTIVINQTPSRNFPRVAHPTIGPAIGDLLKVDAGTPADTDHVPSFAAKMFVVRAAPAEFFPPGYEVPFLFPRLDRRVEVPRTKFFCEEQKYLPGIYADVQLGCKVFHLCLPAAMGNTLTSFMCPNMTLFDQSIMQCNHWYYVNCENSPKNYDANLQMALSYRKMNAAQLPLTAVRDFDHVALLSHNSEEMKNHKTISPADPAIAENLAFRRIGRAEVKDAREKMDDDSSDGNFRQPRTMFAPEDKGKTEDKIEEKEEEKKGKAEDKIEEKEEEKKPAEEQEEKTRVRRSLNTSQILPTFFRRIRRS